MLMSAMNQPVGLNGRRKPVRRVKQTKQHDHPQDDGVVPNPGVIHLLLCGTAPDAAKWPYQPTTGRAVLARYDRRSAWQRSEAPKRSALLDFNLRGRIGATATGSERIGRKCRRKRGRRRQRVGS